MEEERAVHPIVPNKSLDFEGFTTLGCQGTPHVVVITTRLRSVRSVTFRSRKVYWGRKHTCTI
jgi:hypothetical protein